MQRRAAVRATIGDWLIDWLIIFVTLQVTYIILKNIEKESEWQGSLNWKPGAYKLSNRVTSENKRTHTPPPPLHSKLGCLLFSKGSSNSGTTLHGGDGGEIALFSPFEVGKTSEGRFSALAQSVSTNFVADCTFEWRGRGVEGVLFVSPKLPQLRTISQQFCRQL